MKMKPAWLERLYVWIESQVPITKAQEAEIWKGFKLKLAEIEARERALLEEGALEELRSLLEAIHDGMRKHPTGKVGADAETLRIRIAELEKQKEARARHDAARAGESSTNSRRQKRTTK